MFFKTSKSMNDVNDFCFLSSKYLSYSSCDIWRLKKSTSSSSSSSSGSTRGCFDGGGWAFFFSPPDFCCCCCCCWGCDLDWAGTGCCCFFWGCWGWGWACCCGGCCLGWACWGCDAFCGAGAATYLFIHSLITCIQSQEISFLPKRIYIFSFFP